MVFFCRFFFLKLVSFSKMVCHLTVLAKPIKNHFTYVPVTQTARPAVGAGHGSLFGHYIVYEQILKHYRGDDKGCQRRSVDARRTA